MFVVQVAHTVNFNHLVIMQQMLEIQVQVDVVQVIT
jgi:hypothetical protein